MVSRTPAVAPTCAAVGSRPMAAVEAPIRLRVITRVFLRPMRSPMWLKMMPPIGRTTNASAKEASDSRVLVSGSSDGKNSGPKTMPASVP